MALLKRIIDSLSKKQNKKCERTPLQNNVGVENYMKYIRQVFDWPNPVHVHRDSLRDIGKPNPSIKKSREIIDSSHDHSKRPRSGVLRLTRLIAVY